MGSSVESTPRAGDVPRKVEGAGPGEPAAVEETPQAPVATPFSLGYTQTVPDPAGVRS